MMVDGWLRESPPPQEKENTEETEPRETFPETSPPRSPMPKLQQQLQIHLHRLPDFILRSPVYLPLQLPQCGNQCTAQLHPNMSQPVAQPAMAHSSHTTTQFCPELPQPEAHDGSSHPITDTPQKSLLVRLCRLPQSVVHSDLHLHSCLLPSSEQHSQFMLDSTVTKHSSKMCIPEQNPQCDVQHLDIMTETFRGNRDKSVPLQTVDPYTELQEGTQKEHDTIHGDKPEEEEDPFVKGTALQNCPTTDPSYVLRSQNPADCASVNILTGLTNGFPQKGLLQNKYKIRVDFKVRCCTKGGKQFLFHC